MKKITALAVARTAKIENEIRKVFLRWIADPDKDHGANFWYTDTGLFRNWPEGIRPTPEEVASVLGVEAEERNSRVLIEVNRFDSGGWEIITYDQPINGFTSVFYEEDINPEGQSGPSIAGIRFSLYEQDKDGGSGMLGSFLGVNLDELKSAFMRKKEEGLSPSETDRLTVLRSLYADTHGAQFPTIGAQLEHSGGLSQYDSALMFDRRIAKYFLIQRLGAETELTGSVYTKNGRGERFQRNCLSNRDQIAELLTGDSVKPNEIIGLMLVAKENSPQHCGAEATFFLFTDQNIKQLVG